MGIDRLEAKVISSILRLGAKTVLKQSATLAQCGRSETIGATLAYNYPDTF